MLFLPMCDPSPGIKIYAFFCLFLASFFHFSPSFSFFLLLFFFHFFHFFFPLFFTFRFIHSLFLFLSLQTQRCGRLLCPHVCRTTGHQDRRKIPGCQNLPHWYNCRLCLSDYPYLRVCLAFSRCIHVCHLSYWFIGGELKCTSSYVHNF